MPGELWRSTAQIGKETTAGTAVAATRRQYWREPVFTVEREPRPQRYATTTRDNVRAFTLGPQVVAGSATMALSADELIEWLLMAIKSAVTPTTPGGTSPRLWAFTPGTALEPATIEWDDGANVWVVAGAHIDGLTFSGSANGEATVAAEFFGRSLTTGSLTGALAERTPTLIEGWETKLYIDPFGGTAGTTVKNDLLISYEVAIKNNLMRKYFAANTNTAGGVVIGDLEVEATLLIEAAAAQADTEYTNWIAGTKRLVRLELGNNEVIETTYKRFVTIDLPGAWSAMDLGQTDEGTRAYELKLQYVYDATNAYGVQIRAQNSRATAW